MVSSDETELAYRIKASNKKAFKEAYLSFYKAVSFFIYQYICNAEVAKDLAQEAFFLLWKNRDRLNEKFGYKSYLISIAKNLSLNYIRAQKYNAKYINQESLRALDTFTKGDNLLYKKFEAKDTLSRIYNEIDNLPKKQKDVLIMSRMHNFTNKQIAEKLNISIKTVEYRLMNALKIIRKNIE